LTDGTEKSKKKRDWEKGESVRRPRASKREKKKIERRYKIPAGLEPEKDGSSAKGYLNREKK